MKRVFLFLLIPFVSPAFSQDAKSVDEITQTKLKPLVKQLYQAKTSEDQIKYNLELLKAFEQAIELDSKFNYAFDSLKKDIGILISPDKKFRIIHWNIPKSDGTHEYYGFIQSKFTTKKNKEESVQIFPLTDKSAEIKNPDNAITDHNKWFGALYSKI